MRRGRTHIVVAMDERGGIGKNGALPWRHPADLAHFKRLTMGHPIIFGRTTYEGIAARGGPLPGRTNIVITSDHEYVADGAIVAHSLEEAIRSAAGCRGGEDIFVCGGARVYARALEYADVLHITRIAGVYDADTFFPDVPWRRWRAAITRKLPECPPAPDAYYVAFERSRSVR